MRVFLCAAVEYAAPEGFPEEILSHGLDHLGYRHSNCILQSHHVA